MSIVLTLLWSFLKSRSTYYDCYVIHSLWRKPTQKRLFSLSMNFQPSWFNETWSSETWSSYIHVGGASVKLHHANRSAFGRPSFIEMGRLESQGLMAKKLHRPCVPSSPLSTQKPQTGNQDKSIWTPCNYMILVLISLVLVRWSTI